MPSPSSKDVHIGNSCIPLLPQATFDLDALVQEASQLGLDHEPDLLGSIDVVTPVAPSPSNPASDQKQHQSHRNRKRAERRRAQIQENGHLSSDRTIFEHVQLSDTLDVHLDTSNLPADSSGYGAVRLNRSRSDVERVYGLEELQEAGFELIQWNGRECKPLIDCRKRIFGVLAGMPDDSSYVQAAHRVSDLLLQSGHRGSFHPKEINHPRGNYPALAFGISYGGGQARAQRLRRGKHDELVEQVLRNPDVRRIAQYADASFQLWAPRLHHYYHHTLRRVVEKTQESVNFEGSVFAAATINMGAHVRTFMHRDGQNLPHGWCAVTALGEFDPTAGGHLILWDLKLVIEFPAGSTILIPSAALTHSNTPVRDSETRQSFTQYTAGGIFRWVENGFMSEECLKSLNKEEYDRMSNLKGSRFQNGLSMYSTLDELCGRI